MPQDSLNDILFTGPTLQPDLMLLISNWRIFKYVFNGDVEKMYRQVVVHKDNSLLRDYKLKTVTFGVNCAPFLVFRTSYELAENTKSEFPLATQVLKSQTYVCQSFTSIRVSVLRQMQCTLSFVLI